jgi:methionyl-tRNA formyltransferase
VDAGHDVRLVVTRADKRRGRGGGLSPTPVKEMALELGLPVVHEVAPVVDSGAQLGVVVAFGRIIKPDVLARIPMVNVHFSLLPRWRGAAPVERAILAGDSRTGVCLMKVEEGLDTGGVYRCASVPIGADETAPELTARLAEMGASLLVEALRVGLGQPSPQAGDATYAAKIEPEEHRLEWSRSAVELHRVVRVGRAWTSWRGRRLLLLSTELAPAVDFSPGALVGDVAATGEGGLRLIRVQPEGKAAVAALEWLRGARPQPAERLGL